MTQQTLFTNPPIAHADITARKHKGNPASVAANPSDGIKSRDMRTILAFIQFRGETFSKEIVRETGISLQTVSGRLADLKRAGRIYDTGNRAEGCGTVKAR